LQRGGRPYRDRDISYRKKKKVEGVPRSEPGYCLSEENDTYRKPPQPTAGGGRRAICMFPTNGIFSAHPWTSKTSSIRVLLLRPNERISIASNFPFDNTRPQDYVYDHDGRGKFSTVAARGAVDIVKVESLAHIQEKNRAVFFCLLCGRKGRCPLSQGDPGAGLSELEDGCVG